jgi:histidinol-phosphate phosphatase family protein
MTKRFAVFLDRDGTLIEDSGFIRDPSEVIFYPNTLSALGRLREFALFIVTNQNGIAKGKLSSEEARRVNDHVVRCLAEAGVEILETYCCPHERRDDCKCIKPKPFFLRLAESEYEIDLANSWVVGDHPQDAELAINAGARGIYVLSGHGQKHLPELSVSCDIVKDIGEAVERIIEMRLRSSYEGAASSSPNP